MKSFVLLDQAHGIRMAQFIQEAYNRLVIRIVKESDHTATAAADFLNQNRALVGSEMKIEVHYLSYDELRIQNPGRFRVVISRSGSLLTPACNCDWKEAI